MHLYCKEFSFIRQKPVRMADLPGKAPPPVPTKPVTIKSDRFRHSMYASTPPTGEDHALGQRSHTMELTSKPKPMPRPKPAQPLPASGEDSLRGQDERVSTFPVLTRSERVPVSSMKHVAAVPKSQFKSHADMHGGVAYFNGTAPKMAGKQAVSAGERRGSKQPLSSTMAFANKLYDQWKESRGLQKKISGAVSMVRGELFPQHGKSVSIGYMHF